MSNTYRALQALLAPPPLQIGTVDLWGQEVNAASKLGEDTAKAGEVLVTDAFRKATEGQGGWTFDPIEAVRGSEVNWRVGTAVR